MYAAHKKKAKACNSAGLNNKAKWSKQNVAKCFCKVRNHAQCFILNISGKYHCCLRIKDLNAVSNPKFFHVSIDIFRDFQGPRPRRDIGIARPRRDRDETETLKNVSRDIQLWPLAGAEAESFSGGGCHFKLG